MEPFCFGNVSYKSRVTKHFRRTFCLLFSKSVVSNTLEYTEAFVLFGGTLHTLENHLFVKVEADKTKPVCVH